MKAGVGRCSVPTILQITRGVLGTWSGRAAGTTTAPATGAGGTATMQPAALERSTGHLEAFLVDLGSAAATVTVTGGPRRSSEPVGTVDFMAPEMWEGSPVDHRADLWSLGALMYALLTGVRVIDRDDEDEPIEVPPPAVIVPKIPAAISDLVMVALARVEDRFPSAVAMMAAIDASLAVLPPPALVPPRRRASMPLWATVGGMAGCCIRLTESQPLPLIFRQRSPLRYKCSAGLPPMSAVPRVLSGAQTKAKILLVLAASQKRRRTT